MRYVDLFLFLNIWFTYGEIKRIRKVWKTIICFLFHGVNGKVSAGFIFSSFSPKPSNQNTTGVGRHLLDDTWNVPAYI